MDLQREYKLAAIQSKQQGDTERATKYYRIAKVTATALRSEMRYRRPLSSVP